MNASIGRPPTEDRPFQHYTLGHRFRAWVSQHLFDQVTYTVRHGLLTGMRRRGGLGWIPQVLVGGAESKEVGFFRRLDLSGLVVYDVGAFQGLMTLHFARRAGSVVCFEPNTRNRARLVENLTLNGLTNVTVRSCGLGSRERKHTMAFLPLMPGGGSLDEETVAHLKLNSATALEEIEVTTLDLERRREHLPPPDFIKIDIEGYELEALHGARETLVGSHPALYLEMHGETIAEKRRKVVAIVEHLVDLGYRTIEHVESGAPINSANSSQAMEGHLYCRWGDR